MYAIIELGGRQWKVEPGTRFDVNRLPAEVGGTHTVDRVLFAQDGSQATVGRPYVQGASVVCEVLEHRQGPKVIAYHFRRRENWRKTVGHRQPLTRLLVKGIMLGGVSTAAAAVETPAPARKPAARASAAAKAPATAKRPTVRRTKGAGHGA